LRFQSVALLLLTAAPLAAQTAVPSLNGWSKALAGNWSCSGAFASGKPLAADVSFTPSLNGRWLTYHHQDRAPGRYEASATLGPASRDTTIAPVTIYDNFGGNRRFLPTLAGTELVLLRDTTEVGARLERFTFRPRGAGGLWFAWELARNGAWVLGDSLACVLE
jgi:hypothetical protein